MSLHYQATQVSRINNFSIKLVIIATFSLTNMFFFFYLRNYDKTPYNGVME